MGNLTVWLCWAITSDGRRLLLGACKSELDARNWRANCERDIDENTVSPAKVLGVHSVYIEPLEVK